MNPDHLIPEGSCVAENQHQDITNIHLALSSGIDLAMPSIGALVAENDVAATKLKKEVLVPQPHLIVDVVQRIGQRSGTDIESPLIDHADAHNEHSRALRLCLGEERGKPTPDPRYRQPVHLKAAADRRHCGIAAHVQRLEEVRPRPGMRTLFPSDAPLH
jgi:hypothetical protein